MGTDRAARLAPLTGVLAVLLVVASTLVIGFYEYLPEPSEIREFLTDNSTAVAVGAYLGLAGSVFLIWFAGSVRAALRRSEGGDGRVSAISLGGGVALGAIMLVAYSGILAAAVRAGASGGLSDTGAATLYDLAATLQGVGAGYAMAAFIGAHSAVAFRTGAAPRWLAWIGALLAVASVTPFGYAVLAADLLWVVYVSITLYVNELPRAPAAV